MTFLVNSLGAITAIVVFIIAAILIILALVGAAADMPGWIVLALIAGVAAARLT